MWGTEGEERLATVLWVRPVIPGDATVLHTMVRSNPGILYLEDGVVKGKWHHNDTPGDEVWIRPHKKADGKRATGQASTDDR